MVPIVSVFLMGNFYFSQFDRRNGSTRAIVIQDALQIANIVDLVSYQYFDFDLCNLVYSYITPWLQFYNHLVDKRAEYYRRYYRFGV